MVVLGDVMVDVVVRPAGPIAHGSDTPSRIVTRPGGAGANVAAALAGLGAPTTLVGCVGDDAAGAEARAALARAGIAAHLAVDGAAATGLCVILVDASGERTMLPDPGANDRLPACALPDPAAHLHVCGYALLRMGSRPAARAALAEARARGMTTSLDPSSAAPLAAVGASEFRAMARGVGTLLVTLDEAHVLCGTRDPEAIAADLLRDHDEVVLKRGPDGASRWGRDGVRAHVPASPPPGAVTDTTGAGDAFSGAWLAARCGGAAPGAALAAACARAARAVVHAGAR